MELQSFIDFGADILANFGVIPDLLLNTTIFDTPIWTIVLGAGLGVYVGWLVLKWTIDL